jgi:hypothetical protein
VRIFQQRAYRYVRKTLLVAAEISFYSVVAKCAYNEAKISVETLGLLNYAISRSKNRMCKVMNRC